MPRPDRSRAALVDAAALLFHRQGYAATGVNQVLELADVKAGSLYHHFPDGKQQLAAAVVERAGADIARRLRALLDSGAPVTDVVDGWLELMGADLAGDQRDGCPIEPIATESVHASAAVRASSAAAFESWSRAVTALNEGALILSRTAGDPAPLHAAKAAARTLLGLSGATCTAR